jgi:hypothetical protein
MSGIGWLSQAYPPDGASAGEGIRNQLGRPELDLLTVLVREAAQNSWDARRGSSVVDFQIDVSTVSPLHASSWRELLLKDAPLNEHLPLRSGIAAPVIRLLTVSDRGTTGLGGPTRADKATGRIRDFAAFVRNSGEPRDKALGGGTYGFGKGIFYLLARSGTILIHTRCETENGLETRLMGCALWNSYIVERHDGAVPYTGRHWWGVRGDDGIVEPLINEEADDAARRLGLRGFGPGETGTTIVLVDPNLDEHEPADAARYLAETITYQLWPKMLDSPTGQPGMRFSVGHNNETVPVPDPRTTMPLRLFVSAYQASRGADARKIECLRPRRELGRLGLAKQLTIPEEASAAAMTAGLDKGVHHVCLMRPTELVVCYLPGPKPLSENLSYAGVFRADESLDEVYAKAEPPTHDNWIADNLDGQDRTFIRTTFRRLGEVLDEYNGVGASVRTAGAAVPLGAASSMFSDLIAGVWGTGGATDFARPPTPAAQPTAQPTPPPWTPAARHTAAGWSANGGVTPPDPGTPWTPPPQEPYTPSGSAQSTWNAATPVTGVDPGAWRERTDPSGVTRPPAARPALRYEGDPMLDDMNGEPVVMQAFSLPVAGGQRVSAELHVVVSSTGNDREKQAPVAAATPTVIGWRDNLGGFTPGQTADVDGGDGRIWWAVVRPAPDTITEIELRVSAVSAS